MKQPDGVTFDDRVQLTADLVAAYISNNSLQATQLPDLIQQVYVAFARLGSPAAAASPDAGEPSKATSAQIKRSITPDALISFIDGKPYKALRRHLSVQELTPEIYRQRYGLPNDYPMVAASYSAARSALAKALGLGRPGGRAAPDEEQALGSPRPPDTKRGRRARGKARTPADA